MKNCANIGGKIKRLAYENLQLSVIIILPLIIGIFRPNYLTVANLNNVLDLSSILIISALGFYFVMECGMIDLSIEVNMALSGVVMAKLLQKFPNLGIFSLLIAITVSALIGFINGYVHTKFKIPSFMATLGMAYIASGLCTIITRGQYITFPNRELREMAVGRIGGSSGIIPNTIIFALVVVIIIWFMAEKIKHGRHALAVGGDEQISSDMGINVNRTKIISFVIAGATFGLAGALLALKLGAGDSFSATGYTFETISACVIGGISISGGIGRMHKAIIGAVIITIIKVGMVFFVVPSNVQEGIFGLIIIVTVALTLDRSKLAVIR